MCYFANLTKEPFEDFISSIPQNIDMHSRKISSSKISVIRHLSEFHFSCITETEETSPLSTKIATRAREYTGPITASCFREDPAPIHTHALASPISMPAEHSPLISNRALAHSA